MLTDDELRQIMPNCPAQKRADYLPFIQQAMQEFDIGSYLRETAFLAQLAHEGAELVVLPAQDQVSPWLWPLCAELSRQSGVPILATTPEPEIMTARLFSAFISTRSYM